MLGDAEKRAIVRVEVFKDKTFVQHGTGFLIAQGQVLTAAHAPAADDGEPAGDEVWLRFGATVGWPAGIEPRVQATLPTAGSSFPAQMDRTVDWAILPCTPPPAVTPLTPQRRAVSSDNPRWCTFGHGGATTRGPERGQPFHGNVTDVTMMLISLSCDELAAGQGSTAAGLSGAPLIVRGVVVGMIVLDESNNPSGASLEGRMYAVPIDQIAAAAGGVFAVHPVAVVPFEGAIGDALGEKRGALKDIGDHLKVPEAQWDKDVGQLKALIARGFHEKGLTCTTNVACRWHLDLGEPDRLLDYVETFWVPDQAAAALAAIKGQQLRGRAAALNCTKKEVLVHYLRRAGGHAGDGSEGWIKQFYSLSLVGAGEVASGEAEIALRELFRRDFHWDTDAEIQAGLQAPNAAHNPFFVALDYCPAVSDVAAHLEDVFPGIHVLIQTDTEWPNDLAHVRPIVPAIPRGEAERAVAAGKKARDDLQSHRTRTTRRR